MIEMSVYQQNVEQFKWLITASVGIAPHDVIEQSCHPFGTGHSTLLSFARTVIVQDTADPCHINAFRNNANPCVQTWMATFIYFECASSLNRSSVTLQMLHLESTQLALQDDLALQRSTQESKTAAAAALTELLATSQAANLTLTAKVAPLP